MSVAIRVKDLTKKYKLYQKRSERLANAFGKEKNIKEFYALKGVSFEISKGECVGIIGHNGAGKSTLLKLLTGVAFPTSGEIEINGRLASMLELGSGFNPELTGMENIYFNGSLNGLTKEEIDGKLKDILEFADIGNFIEQPVKNYSSGMFARLAFAVAINVDPDILIVDEILSVGDVGFQVKCMEKFNEFKKKGKTILYVSHGLGTVKKFCDRAIWLQKGEVVDDGNSVIVVERYYNLNFNPANIEQLKDHKSDIINSIVVKSNTKNVEYLEKLDLEVEYDLISNDLKDPNIVLEFRKTDYEPGTTRGNDQFVCGINSKDNIKNIPFNLGVNKLKVSLNKVNLVAGVYYIDFVLRDGEEEVYRKINGYSFTLNDKYRGEGFLILGHSWGN
ncbi:TPA: polysaccharide ABC transporter ATP-binding protein [Clostridium perfringens]|uniref:ATP-binding cassette domain-containing protein n=1 Tax=Clostridium perfringens TaxID=1502 RepID=A0AAW9I0F3_CLOPF|nr:ABC transporter ATP-binding protein [Clostridium perfringens]AQW22655.1 teichoic acid ABC transporter ATP-binding protein [Clostridium perfringens]EGT2192381.1 ATP-binding cassette domain-containing protein [Clostridium perfringens]EHA0993530.1 ATP-binding cassette domain-containing protein [Clostridium perfringens]EHA1184537.1 ATP-binding cassette domain-containing protein [Clostridium perfringens]EHA6441960.1 ATP-binding cassette domain-containing protein [Clostridium perfringens]